MKKQILTGLGVLILGTSMAVASPQSFRGNFNDQPQYQTQQQQRWNPRGDQRQQQRGYQGQRDQRVSNPYSRYSRRAPQQRHKISRAKHRNNRDRRGNWRG